MSQHRKVTLEGGSRRGEGRGGKGEYACHHRLSNRHCLLLTDLLNHKNCD